ncbi:MAG: hypothetical protein WCI65_02005 [Synechococcaceae cyanobacterium ELA263]
MTTSAYASFLDTSADIGGLSHAAWNENGVLLHAIWDPEAARWGEAAQIANATSARNIQLTPGRTEGPDSQPLLLASWESGEGNNADLFLSVGFYESDGTVVWSDVVPFRTNGQADHNHRVGVSRDGAFVVSNEVRQDPAGRPVLDGTYQDSEIATTVLRVSLRQGVADDSAVSRGEGSALTILNLGQGEQLLRVKANGQWLFLEENTPVALPRLGILSKSGSQLSFTPDAAFQRGSLQFTFEKVTSANVLSRSSFEVFANTASTVGASYRLQLQEAGGLGFESLPIQFSQAINRERISREAFASLVPRRGGASTFRELAGDGLFGDRAQRATSRQPRAQLLQLSAAASGSPSGDEGAPVLAAAPSGGLQETYADSFSIGALFDPYELRPNLATRWNISFEDISKAADGATFPLGGWMNRFGKNFGINFSGNVSYLKDVNTVGYEVGLSLSLSNSIDVGDPSGNDRPLSDRSTFEDGSAVFPRAARLDRLVRREGFFKKKQFRKGGTFQAELSFTVGSLFGKPFLQRFTLGFDSQTTYAYSPLPGGLYEVQRNPESALLRFRTALTWGGEGRFKLGGLLGEAKDFTLLQARASAGLTVGASIEASLQNVTLQGSSTPPVLQYRNDLELARLNDPWLVYARPLWASVYWLNVLNLGVANPVGNAGNVNYLDAVLELFEINSSKLRSVPGVLGTINSGLAVAADIPWILAFAGGLAEFADVADSARRAGGDLGIGLTLSASADVATSVSLFNRAFGGSLSTGAEFEGQLRFDDISKSYAMAQLYLTLVYTLAGVDFTFVDTSTTLFDTRPRAPALRSTRLAAAGAGASVAVVDYSATDAAALGSTGLDPALRPADGAWPLVPLVGEGGDLLAAPAASSGRLLRAVLAVPDVVDPGDLNADGTVRNLRLQLTSPGALKVVVDRRALTGQALPYDSSEPWLTVLDDGASGSVSRTVSTAVIAGARPGDFIPLYLDCRADLTAMGGSPELRIGLVIGAAGSYRGGGEVLLPAMPDSPTLTLRRGSTYVLGVQDLPDPEGGTPGSQRQITRLSDPYLAGLILQSPGHGYRGSFDFVVQTAPDQGGRARAQVSGSTAAFIDQITLVNPGDAAAGEALGAFRSRLQAALSGSTPFRNRLSGGTPARASVQVDGEGAVAGLVFAFGQQGSGYLAGGSGSFYQALQLDGGRELVFKVAVRDGKAVSAGLLSSRGRFSAGESLQLNDDASGGGQGASLLPVVRDWRLLNLVDEQDISIGSEQRFQDNSNLGSGTWLAYSQAAPLGGEKQPIAAQGARINQAIRIGQFGLAKWNLDHTIRRVADDPATPQLELTPGVDGYNINPVIAEVTGGSATVPDQVLVFSYSDTSMIRSEDDLYLLDQALLRSRLYYSYRVGRDEKAVDAWSIPLPVPVQLPVGVSPGLSNNRPYLTPFDNTGGARLNPAARDLPPSLLLAWLSSDSPQSFDADVTIDVTIGSTLGASAGENIRWGPVDQIDPGDGISSDDIVNLSLTYQDGLPVLSWSVLTEQPYLAQVLEDKPLLLLRLDESTGSDSLAALGEFAGTAAQRIARDQLSGYGSSLPFQLNTSDSGTLQSLDEGALWEASLGSGDPNQALRFRGGEFLELVNPLALRALADQQKIPSGYAVDFWIRPQADGQGRLPDGSIIDAGLYNPAALLPVDAAVRLPFELVRQAALNSQGERGYRYILQLAADAQANLNGITSAGLSPYNLATILQAQSLTPVFADGPAVTLSLPELVLNDALTYQTLNGALSNLFSGTTATELWSEFRADVGVSAEQVQQGSSQSVNIEPLPLRFEPIKGWSLRQQNGELVFTWGENGSGPLSLKSSDLKIGDWNHLQLAYGFSDNLAPLNGNNDKRATLVINGQLVASADDLGLPTTLAGQAVLDYAGFDFNALPVEVGYGYRGDLDELAFFASPLEGLETSAQQRQQSRFVDPRSATEATFFSNGQWDAVSGSWQWAEPEKFTYSLSLGASEPSSDRRANGQQVIDLAGPSARALRGDGFPDAVIAATLPREIPLGSRLSGIRIESNGQVFAVGDGIRPDETIAGLVGVLANQTPTNALLNQKADPAELDLAVLASNTQLRLAYGSSKDYYQGRGGEPIWENNTWVQKLIAGYQAPVVSYFYRTPQQQLNVQNTPLQIQAGSTASVIANPSSGVLERGSAFFDYSLVAKAIVARQAPAGLAEVNSGFKVSLQADPSPANRYADRLEVGRLGDRSFAAILSGQADLKGGSAIVLLDLSAQSESDLQKLRKLDAGDSSLADNTREALQAAGVQGLRIQTASGASIGSTLLWADLDADGQQELILGNPAGDNGNGEVWMFRGSYLQQVIKGTRLITLGDSLVSTQPGNVRRLRLSGAEADRASFGTSLAVGRLDGNGTALVIGAPSQLTGGNNTDGSASRHGKVWRLQGSDLFNAPLSELASGALYASSGTGKPPAKDIEFGTTLAFARLNGASGAATLLVGLPGLEASYELRNGGHTGVSADQLSFYLEVLRTTAPRDSEPPASETVTVEAGGVLALDLANDKRVLIVGETFGGDAARSGEGLASGGSLDGDGLDEVAIGLPQEDNGTGAVAVLKGSDLRTWLAAASAGVAPSYRGSSTRALIPHTSLYIQGVEEGDRLGRIMRLDGNLVGVQQSNFNELVIGDPLAADGTGEIQVLTGQPLSSDPRELSPANLLLDGMVFHELAIPDPRGRITLTPGRSYAGFGSAVALADVNDTASGGGSLADLVMASSTLGSNLTVLYGKDVLLTRDRLDLRDIASGQGLDFALSDGVITTGARAAASTSTLADINADGFADAVLGKGITSLELAYGASTEAGASHPDAGTGGSATLEFGPQLARLQGRVVTTLPGGSGIKSLTPQIQAVQAVGDFDGDGASELLITSAFRDRLLEGETLGVGESLVSANLKYIATMQNDGNFVIYTQLLNGERRVLFSLDSGFLPTFKGGLQGGSVLQVRGGELQYVRPAGWPTEQLDLNADYSRQRLDGSRENVRGKANFTANGSSRGDNFAQLILQEDGNLVGYGRAVGVSPADTVYLALQPAAFDIQRQALAGAVIDRVNPAAAPVQSQSLLFSAAANSNAGLAANQVLEAIDSSALRALGIARPGPFLGSVWLNGIQTLLFAHPDADRGVNANQLLLAQPNPEFRSLYANTAELLRAWGAALRVDAGTSSLIEQIIAAFEPAVSAGVDDRYQAALANAALATERLEASAAGRGLDFQQYLAAAAPLYRLQARTLLDPITNQPLAYPIAYSLADLNGDGWQELIVDDPSSSRAFSVLDPAALSAAQVEAPSFQLQSLPYETPNDDKRPSFHGLRPIGDANGDGRDDLIAYDTSTGNIQLLLGGGAADGRPLLRLGVALDGARRSAGFVGGRAGDVNGDGVDDFVVEGDGGFYVVYGVGGGANDRSGPFSGGLYQINDVDPVSGIAINTFIRTLPGWTLSDLRGGEDFNGDGLSDIQVTLSSSDEPASLRGYVLFGGDFTQARSLAIAGSELGHTMQSITQMGTIGFDSLRGTPVGDTAIGREGDDLLNGLGGPDVLNGGPGSDVIIVADDQFRRVDGGSGQDSLLLNGALDQAWDLTGLASGGRIANFETIDIRDFGGNALSLNTAAFLAISDSRRDLLIEGDAPTRTPLQELILLLDKADPRFAEKYQDYALRKGINDQQLRVSNDDKDPVALYSGVFSEFWNDYSNSYWSEYRQVEQEYTRSNGARFQSRVVYDTGNIGGSGRTEIYDAWAENGVLPLFNQALTVRVRPEFTTARRDVLLQQLQAELGRPHDTVILADGPGELRLDSGSPVLVVGSDRYWVYTALKGSARLLVRDGVRVLRSAAVGRDLTPTPWWTVPTGLAPLAPAPVGSERLLLGSAAPTALLAAAAVPVAQAMSGDQRFLVDTPVVSQSEQRITFTVQRTGYLDETSRLAFRVLGYTAGLVPAGYGQVVFAPGETHRTLQVPLIQLEASAELLPNTEVSVELIPLPAGSPGPRRTASYAINGLNEATESLPDPVLPLPAQLLAQPELVARGVGLPLGFSLTSRERIQNSSPAGGPAAADDEVVFGLSGIQGLGVNDVWLRTNDGRYLSSYDPAFSGILRHLQDDLEEVDGDLFMAVRDGSLLDGDGQRDGAVNLTALPVLSSPGVVLVNGRVLRAPTRGDGDLWIDLKDLPASLAKAELLLVPVLDQEGTIPGGAPGLRPGDAGYSAGLEAWIATNPAALRRIALAPGSLSQQLQLQSDTDYQLLLRSAAGALLQPAISAAPGSQGRSLGRYRLQGDGLDLTLQLSSNRWVMPGVAGADPLLVASFLPGALAGERRIEVALVRCDSLSGGFDGDDDGRADLLPGDPGYLVLLAARLAQADGALLLAANQPRAVVPFMGSDAVIPVLFDGITMEAWLALPAEQQSLSGNDWRVWIDGHDDQKQQLRRTGPDRWQLAGGGSLQIDLAETNSGDVSYSGHPTRQSLGGAERQQIIDLGYAENRISDVVQSIGLVRRSPSTDSTADAARFLTWASIDTAALAGSLWTVDRGLGAGLAPSLLQLSDVAATPFNLRTQQAGARYYNLHGLPYDTLLLSGSVQDLAGAGITSRYSLASTPCQPRLDTMATGLILRDGSEDNTGSAPYSTDLTITLNPAAAADLRGLQDITYFLVSGLDPAVAPESLSRESLLAAGLQLFGTSFAFDQYLSGSFSEALFRSSIQLPVGNDIELVALGANDARGQILKPSPRGDGSGVVDFSGSEGVRLWVDPAGEPAGIEDCIARDQLLAPALNLQGLEGRVAVEIEISREASLTSSIGFFRSLDLSGGVPDPLTGRTLYPGEQGYGAAALSESNTRGLPGGLSAADRTAVSYRADLDPGVILLPYATTDSGETYLPFALANSDGYAHFRVIGRNVFGYEDLPAWQSDFDHDDGVISIRIPTV